MLKISALLAFLVLRQLGQMVFVNWDNLILFFQRAVNIIEKEKKSSEEKKIALNQNLLDLAFSSTASWFCN